MRHCACEEVDAVVSYAVLAYSFGAVLLQL
jgi:hypothetical protein